MALVVIDATLPACIALGAQSNPMWEDEIVTLTNGYEKANEPWLDARHDYDISFAVRTVSDYQMIRTHFHQCRGRARAFLFKDFLDFSATQTVGLGVATGVTNQYQMYKRYGSGSDVYDRKITRPRTGTVTFYRTRSAVTTTITVTADYNTGLFVVSGHVNGDTYSWAGEFRVPVRYDTKTLPGAAVDREGQGELLVRCDSIPLVEVKE